MQEWKAHSHDQSLLDRQMDVFRFSESTAGQMHRLQVELNSVRHRSQFRFLYIGVLLKSASHKQGFRVRCCFYTTALPKHHVFNGNQQKQIKFLFAGLLT